MIIGVDGNEANVQNRVGVGEYAFELLKQFNKSNLPAGGLEFRVYLKEKPLSDLPGEDDRWRYRVVKPKKLWTQFGLPLDLYFYRPRPGIFFSPTHYAPRFCPVPSVISIMDLSFLYFPEMFKKSDRYQLKNWTAYSVKMAKKIFTISQASKNDIIEKYSLPEKRVVVTYLGYKMKADSRQKNFKVKYGIEREYILFVGTLQPRKNIARLIEAFSTLSQKFSDVDLIIAGKPGWMYEEIYVAPQKFNVVDKVKFLGYVPDDDLPMLYQNAACFVLPSLYEGFGLPVLEAMANDCPVVVSNTSSLPEVGGDAAIYVNPESVESIAEGVTKALVLGEKERNDLINKGREQVKKFSWEKCARETLKVLEEVANKK